MICLSPSRTGLRYDSELVSSKDSKQIHYKQIGDV
ncbi:hypothetical protein HLBENOHH_00869 [Aeromonas dhakensis]